MFNPRSIDQIQQQFLQELLQQNTPLNDISPGSSLYTLARAIAASQSQQDLVLNEFSQTIYLNSAAGYALDLKAADYGLTRKPGSAASGYVLAISQTEEFILDPGAVLVEPTTAQQFQYQGSSSVTISTFSEVRIPVQATAIGERSNLPAGTRLISGVYPQGLFVVGTLRTSAGELCGDLTGGVSAETDQQLRARLVNTVLNSRGTTDLALKTTILREPTVSWASILSPTPGVIQVWIDNPSPVSTSELQRLQQIVTQVKPAGTVLTLHQAERQLIDVNIYVKAALADIQALTDELVGIIHNYLLGLNLGQTFVRNDLLTRILASGLVIEAKVLTPTDDVTPGQFSLLRGDRVWVTYDTI